MGECFEQHCSSQDRCLISALAKVCKNFCCSQNVKVRNRIRNTWICTDTHAHCQDIPNALFTWWKCKADTLKHRWIWTKFGRSLFPANLVQDGCKALIRLALPPIADIIARRDGLDYLGQLGLSGADGFVETICSLKAVKHSAEHKMNHLCHTGQVIVAVSCKNQALVSTLSCQAPTPMRSLRSGCLSRIKLPKHRTSTPAGTISGVVQELGMEQPSWPLNRRRSRKLLHRKHTLIFHLLKSSSSEKLRLEQKSQLFTSGQAHR